MKVLFQMFLAVGITIALMLSLLYLATLVVKLAWY